jgi:hypothetical protein
MSFVGYPQRIHPRSKDRGFLRRRVTADTPRDVLLTSFSILFARFKGDLSELVRGTLAIDQLKPGDRVLIAEACFHHPIAEDIGRVKIPRWLTQKIERYRINEEEIMACVAEAERYGYGTVVFQAGEDYGVEREWLSRIIHR